MKKRIIFRCTFGAIAILAALIFGQCSHYYYAPTLPHVPTLTRAEEGTFTLAGTLQEKSSGVEIHGAYSLVPNWLITGEGTYISGVDRDGQNRLYGKGHGYLVSIGGGIYDFYPTRFQGEQGWHLMALAGVGLGGARNDYYTWNHLNSDAHAWSGNSTITFTRSYLQPSAGWVAPHFEFVLSLRGVWLHQNKIQFNTGASENEALLRHFRDQFLWEPGVTLRLGWERFKFEVQVATLTNAKTPAADANVGFGLLFFPWR